MNRFVWRCLAIALCVLVGQPRGAPADRDGGLQAAKTAAENAERAPMMPRGAFLAKASVRDVTLSPDGRWLAYRRDTGEREALWLRDLNAGTLRRVLADARGVEAFWSHDAACLWLPDESGIGLFDTDTMTGQRIFRFNDERRQRFVKVSRKAPNAALLSEKIATGGGWLYRYLVIDADGETRVVHETEQSLQTALLDAKGNLAYAAGYEGAAYDTVIWRFGEDGGEEVMRCPLPRRCRPIAFSEVTLWALAAHARDRVSLMALGDGSGEWRVVHEDPRGIADAETLRMRPDGEDWLAVAYRPGRLRWHARDPAVREALETLRGSLPGANLGFQSSGDGRRWLVRATGARWLHERHYLFDTAEDVLTPLFEAERTKPIAPGQLAEALPVQWDGRDGMQLHGYVYLPKGVHLHEAPLVAMIHGGPFNRARGKGGPLVQLLANRGYAVFAPNFRASIGYGIDYVTAAKGEFGRHGVLDDILTGLDHLIANGIGDPDRQAVVGHSFGGYASLLAITHHPDRFAFAVASAPPVDFAWTMKDIAVEGGSALSADGPPLEVLFPAFGVPYGDAAWHDRMHRDSPLAHAGELRRPVYIWAGAEDDRVAVESQVRYVAEAGEAKRPVLLIDPDSGHGPEGRINIEALAWLVEVAGHRHFGSGLTPRSDALARFLERNLRTGKSLLRR